MTKGPATDSTDSDAGAIAVTRDTKLTTTIGTIAAAFALVFGGHSFIDARFDSIERTLERIERLQNNRWTHTDMRFWVIDLQRHNSTLKVPTATRQPTDDERARDGVKVGH